MRSLPLAPFMPKVNIYKNLPLHTYILKQHGHNIAKKTSFQYVLYTSKFKNRGWNLHYFA